MTAPAAGRARAAVRRSLILYVPLLLIFAALELAILAQPFTGGSWNIVGLIIVTPFFVILGWHTLNLFQDLRADVVTAEGDIRRKWSRFDLPLSRSYYIYVEGVVYRVPREAWGKLLPGDRVAVTHLPHTATIEGLELLTSGGARQPLA